MAVNETVDGYSTAAASNTPAGTDTVGPDLDDHLRDIKKNVRIIGQTSKAETSPTGFLGRQWLDTSGTATTKITYKMYDGTQYASMFDIDTSAGVANVYVAGNVISGVGKNLAASVSTASARSSIGLTSIVTTGKQTIWVPAAGMRPTVTNGAAPFGAVQIATGFPNVQSIDYDFSATERAQFSVCFPKSWDLGQLTFLPVLTTAVSSQSTVVFGLRAVAVGGGENYSATFGTSILITGTAVTSYSRMNIAESPSLTVANTPANTDLVTFELYRDAQNASDTLTGDAKVQGLHIYYQTNAGNDA